MQDNNTTPKLQSHLRHIKKPKRVVERDCQNCHTVFLIYESKVADGRGVYCCKDCFRAACHYDRAGHWRGGRTIHSGYVHVTLPNNGGTHLEHRLVMEQHIGRPLHPGEIVHHKDKNKQNNSIDNLQIVTASEHAKIHYPDGRIKDWSVGAICCINCATTERPHSAFGLCRQCLHLQNYGKIDVFNGNPPPKKKRNRKPLERWAFWYDCCVHSAIRMTAHIEGGASVIGANTETTSAAPNKNPRKIPTTEQQIPEAGNKKPHYRSNGASFRAIVPITVHVRAELPLVYHS